MLKGRKNSNDHRAIVTKKMIHSAYLKLLQKHPRNPVNVAELCREAEISRGTFYLHYVDILELEQEIQEIVFQQFKTFIDQNSKQSSKEKIDLSNTFFLSLREGSSEYPLYFLIANDNNLKERISQYARNVLVEMCVRSGQLGAHEAELWAVNKIGASIATLMYYYDRNFEGFEEDNRFLIKLAEYGDSILSMPVSSRK